MNNSSLFVSILSPWAIWAACLQFWSCFPDASLMMLCSRSSILVRTKCEKSLRLDKLIRIASSSSSICYAEWIINSLSRVNQTLTKGKRKKYVSWKTFAIKAKIFSHVFRSIRKLFPSDSNLPLSHSLEASKFHQTLATLFTFNRSIYKNTPSDGTFCHISRMDENLNSRKRTFVRKIDRVIHAFATACL